MYHETSVSKERREGGNDVCWAKKTWGLPHTPHALTTSFASNAPPPRPWHDACLSSLDNDFQNLIDTQCHVGNSIGNEALSWLQFQLAGTNPSMTSPAAQQPHNSYCYCCPRQVRKVTTARRRRLPTTSPACSGPARTPTPRAAAAAAASQPRGAGFDLSASAAGAGAGRMVSSAAPFKLRTRMRAPRARAAAGATGMMMAHSRVKISRRLRVARMQRRGGRPN